MTKPNQYDTLVIGAGLGGLSVATSLSQNGYKVLVVEKNEKAGGNCIAFNKDGYRFDYALHQLNGAGKDGTLITEIFKEYKINHLLNFKRVDPFMTIVMPDREYHLASDWDQLQENLVEYFPANKMEIKKFFKKILHDYEDISLVQRLLYGKNQVIRNVNNNISLKNKLTSAFRIPWLFARTVRTGNEYFNHIFTEPKLWALITASWPYLGLPPSRVCGVMLGGFISTEHHEKSYYPVGSSQTITDVLVNSINENGGEIRVGVPVKKIIIENNKAVGLKLESGEEFFGRTIVSNADLTHTLTSLIHEEPLIEKSKQKLNGLRPSIGPFRVFLGLDIDIHEQGMPNFEYLFYKDYDHSKVYEGMQTGYQKVISAYSPSKLDPTAAPKGHSTLTLLTMMAWKPSERDWRIHKKQIANEMIDIIDQRIPGIREHIKFMDILTPEIFEKRTNTFNGAMYGWDLGPDQAILKRHPQKTHIKNLFLSGHWTQPGPGMSTTIISGWMTAKLVRKALRN